VPVMTQLPAAPQKLIVVASTKWENTDWVGEKLTECAFRIAKVL
jgi:hypothetical protein